MIAVGPASPRAPGAEALLRQSHALMLSLFPREHCHFLDIDALCAPDIVFLTAREGSDTLGTGALALREGYGELKSMFTAPAARGRGVAQALLRALEDEARGRDIPLLKIETGAPLTAALRFYKAAGYIHCGPFGTYTANPHSMFLEKRLTA
ncbi:MAG: GNAT family N-acetyltransferase [Shimia sp.]